MQSILIEFEKHAGLPMAGAALLIGCAYVTYTQYRSGLRALPSYHEQHVQDLMDLPRATLARKIQERVYGKS